VQITRAEFGIAGFGLAFLLVGEAISSAIIRGTHFAAVDGKMAEAVIRAAFSLAAPFDVTNLNHIQGVGSLLLPFNVWANLRSWKAIEPRRSRASLPWLASRSPSM